METTREDILADVPLFRLLDREERADLERAFEQRSCAAGETVFSMSEPGDSLYIVSTGSVELFMKDNTGTKIVLMICSAGDIFGELSLLDGGARTATAVCIEDGVLLVLDREDLVAFLTRRPEAAMDLLTTMGQRMRSTDEMLRRRTARNINEDFEVHSTTAQKIADLIAQFSGSLPFLALNALWFAGWIVWNVAPGVHHFDPYPFGFLTMVVSLEAIFLSIFVLVSQNRQAAKDRLRADAEYEVNLKAELEVAQLHEKVDFLTEEILARIPRRERVTKPQQIA